MNKKAFIALLAALLLLSATACNNTGKDTETTGGETDSRDPNESYIVIPGTDANGNDVTYIEPVTKEPEDPGFDPTENAPTFVDCSKEVVVFAGRATVRTATNIHDDQNAVGWPSEGRVLTATGESDNWYRINYKVGDKDTVCYIAKTVAADAAALEGFTAVSEEVEVAVDAVNVRSYPSTKSDLSIRGSLKKGTKVTRIGVSENWSKILYEVVSETETGADGKPVTVRKEYYVSNDCLSSGAETETETKAE